MKGHYSYQHLTLAVHESRTTMQTSGVRLMREIKERILPDRTWEKVERGGGHRNLLFVLLSVMNYWPSRVEKLVAIIADLYVWSRGSVCVWI